MMNETEATPEGAVIAAARAGDQVAFSRFTERYRRELRVHCYRMLGSFDDAEDLVQETLLRAWRGRGTFEGRSGLRAWLYGIATNACLDFLAKHKSRLSVTSDEAPAEVVASPPAEVSWLQPYPDRRRGRRRPSRRRRWWPARPSASPSWWPCSSCRPGSGPC